MPLAPLTESTWIQKLREVSYSSVRATIMKLVTHLTSKERMYCKLSEQLEHLNLGCGHKVWVMVSAQTQCLPPTVSVGLCLISVHLSSLLFHYSILSSLSFSIFPPSAHFKLKIDAYWNHTPLSIYFLLRCSFPLRESTFQWHNHGDYYSKWDDCIPCYISFVWFFFFFVSFSCIHI